jgi:hypothetical protein
MPVNKMIIPPSTPGASTVVGLDPRKGATIYVYTTAAASYDVQATLDDPMTTAPGSVRWTTSVDVPAGQVGSYTGRITTPCNALRLNVASNAAALEVRVLQ